MCVHGFPFFQGQDKVSLGNKDEDGDSLFWHQQLVEKMERTANNKCGTIKKLFCVCREHKASQRVKNLVRGFCEGEAD